jgi:hypothetical protein
MAMNSHIDFEKVDLKFNITELPEKALAEIFDVRLFALKPYVLIEELNMLLRYSCYVGFHCSMLFISNFCK